MNQQLSSPKSPVVSDFKNTVKKVFKWILILIIVIGISMFYWKYFYTYSEGYRAGYCKNFLIKGPYSKPMKEKLY